MRFTSALVLFTVPLLALSKVVIRYTSYADGILHLDIDICSDAPSSYNVVAIGSSGNRYDLATGVSASGSGNLDIALPAFTRPGSYRVRIIDPATGETLSTSQSFTVCQRDFPPASSLGLQNPSYTYAVTGSIIPFVTTSLVTDASRTTSAATLTAYGAGSTESASSVSTISVLTSNTLAVTTDSVVTGSSSTSTVSVTHTITNLVSSSSKAATATPLTSSTVTRSTGFKNTVRGAACALVAAGVAGATMFF